MRVDISSQLRQVPLFSGLDEQSLQDLAKSCRRRQFQAREALFHEGDPGQVLYVIISGQVSVERVTATGEKLHIAQRGPGDHFGEMAIFDNLPRSADVVTETPCELLMLDRSELIRCLERSPKMALSIITCLTARLREAMSQLEGCRKDVMGRLSFFLLEEATKHGTADPAGGIRLSRKLNQQEIADRIGSKRETVNRALSRLKDLDVIRQSEGCLIVIKMDALAHYSEQV